MTEYIYDDLKAIKAFQDAGFGDFTLLGVDNNGMYVYGFRDDSRFTFVFTCQTAGTDFRVVYVKTTTEDNGENMHVFDLDGQDGSKLVSVKDDGVYHDENGDDIQIRMTRRFFNNGDYVCNGNTIAIHCGTVNPYSPLTCCYHPIVVVSGTLNKDLKYLCTIGKWNDAMNRRIGYSRTFWRLATDEEKEFVDSAKAFKESGIKMCVSGMNTK